MASRTTRRKAARQAANAVDPNAARLAPGAAPIVPSYPADKGNGNGNGAGGVSVVSTSRRFYAKLTQTNPLRKLKPDALVRFWDSFQQGLLREFALLMQAVEQWDDVLMAVVPKREAAVKRLKWQVIVNDDVADEQKDEADAHKEALFYFYNNLTCQNSYDANTRGGMALFVELAMKCLGHKWAPFEIIYKPGPDGLTAQMNYVPLQFFENKTGKLRFLKSDFAVNGDELVEDGWVVFCGPGLLIPSAVAYLIKDLARTSWLIYGQNQGMPGVHGTTEAAYLSDQWNAMHAMLEEVLSGGVILTGPNDKVSKLDISATGQLPFPALVQEMNERVATMWRGGSLGTIGTGQGPEQKGVTLQQDEETKLAADDGQRISDTLNQTVDKAVIAWAFGEGVKPLAYFKIAPPNTVDVDREIKIDDHLTQAGVEIGKRQMREQFSRPEPAEDDEPVDKPAPVPAFGAPGQLPQDGEATEDDVKTEADKALAEAGNERVAVLRRLNTPRNAKALNALLKAGKFRGN